MNYMYGSYSRAAKKTPDRLETQSGFSAPAGAGNAQLLGAMGMDSAPGAELASAMQSRFTAHFGTGGSPAAMIENLEQRSGVSLHDVHIHRNAPEPAAIGALAYARGTDVFLGPGQERHLGHELTHVVQQKQGLVRADDSVSGMPVNTSSALEQQADAMAVSSAPETGFAGEGVVQGVFLDPSGRKVKKSELKQVEKMLAGSMDSIHQATEEKLTDAMAQPDKKRMQKGLKKARKQLHKQLKSAHKSKQEVDLAGMMSQIMDDTYGQMGFHRQSYADAMKMGLDSGSVQAGRALAGDEYRINAKDTAGGLLHSMGGFQLPTEAAEGIDAIGEYAPSDEMEELLNARLGNSNTLMARDNETPEQRAKREASANSFKNGAETARQGAALMRESDDNITAGNLFDLFSSINKNVRGGTGGQLRGTKVTVGQLQTPGTAALPEDAYRTFSVIADKMQEIKKTEDPKLAKTQAVHLAAFAYQMTISEHMFGDGNGRSCRLLSDTILQTFGLPPMSPVKELAKAGATIGKEMDFNAGADAVMAGVRQSDQTLRTSRSRKTSDETMAYRTTAVPENYNPETASEDEALATLYRLIKNPRPDDTPETISARKRHFAQLRAQQLKRQHGK